MSTETIATDKIFVWIRSEKMGQIVELDKDASDADAQFLVFKDGSKCSKEIQAEFLSEAKSMDDAKRIAKPFLTASGVKIPGEEPQRDPNPVVEQPKTKHNEEINVMLEMLKKISAKNTISMPLELNVPSKEVYELFKDQMDITKADLNEQILLLVMSQINNLQEQLKPQAEEFIKLYYNGRKAKSRAGSTSTKSTSSTKSGPDITY